MGKIITDYEKDTFLKRRYDRWFHNLFVGIENPLPFAKGKYSDIEHKYYSSERYSSGKYFYEGKYANFKLWNKDAFN